jgi:hypothetical protein
MFHWWSAFWRAHLDNVLEDIGTRTLKYLYDFGDCWEHTIKVERLLEPELGVLYPRLIDATGRCPPIGAPWGYAEFLKAIHVPKHERHAEINEWTADNFDPNVVDADGLAEEVAALAKRWCRKSRAKPTRHI